MPIEESERSDATDFDEVLIGIITARSESAKASSVRQDDDAEAKKKDKVGEVIMMARTNNTVQAHQKSLVQDKPISIEDISCKNKGITPLTISHAGFRHAQEEDQALQTKRAVFEVPSKPSKTMASPLTPQSVEMSSVVNESKPKSNATNARDEVSDASEEASIETGCHVIKRMEPPSPTTQRPSETQSSLHQVGAVAVSSIECLNDLERGFNHSLLEENENGNHVAALDEPITNATLVKDEEVVEAKPAEEGFEALVHNNRFKYLIGAFLLLLLVVIIPVAIVVPRKGSPTIVVEDNATVLECGTALTNQADYRGTISETENGIPCQPWSSQYPNTHSFPPDRFPDAGLTENYCRNPNGDIRPWCVVNVTEYEQTKYCHVPFCDGDRGVDTLLCGTLKGRYQDDYRGKISTTLSGKQCQRWDSQWPHEHEENTPENYPLAGLESNYCRNPSGDAAAWCYTMDSETRWEYCDVPICEVLYFNETVATSAKDDVHTETVAVENSPEVCGLAVVRQAEYRGTINVTVSGRTCQRWDSQVPHENPNTPEAKPNDGLDENYCRNPDSEERAWCYTTDPEKRWEYCDVPFCPSADLKQCGTYDYKQQDYIGTINVTRSGLACQPWAEQSPHYHLHLPALFPEANLVGNACRNPTGVDERAWCYTTSPDVLFEYCDVPFCTTEEERKRSFVCGSRAVHQTDYRGTIAVTVSGRRCQPWASDLPHFQEIPPHPSLEENYCRNPDGEERAWCYTEDLTMRRELCDVPFCEDLENGDEDVP